MYSFTLSVDWDPVKAYRPEVSKDTLRASQLPVIPAAVTFPTAFSLRPDA
jgi:hypothetical protein